MDKAECALWIPDHGSGIKSVPRDVAAFWIRSKWNGRNRVYRQDVNGARCYAIRRPGQPVMLLFVGVQASRVNGPVFSGVCF